MNKTYRSLSHAQVVTAGLALAIVSPAALAHDHDEDAIPFDEAEIFFELNNTDEDLGIHALIDGEGWKHLSIEDPNERDMLNVRVKGRLRRQGLTEIFFESAEPTFDELDPVVFFHRFPEGEYEIEGWTLDSQELASEAELTHLIPAPPVVTVNDEPMAEQCDDEQPGFDATELVDPDEVIIEWEDVTMSHPDADGAGAGVQPPEPVEIENYEVVLETEAENPEDETDTFDAVMSVELPAWVTSFTVPEEFLDLADEFKYEVLAREESFNQTAVESCFVLVEPE